MAVSLITLYTRLPISLFPHVIVDLTRTVLSIHPSHCTTTTVTLSVVLSHSYCILLYCTVLYFTVLYTTLLNCILLYCTVLYFTVLYSTLLYCILLYSTVFFFTLLYSSLLYCILLCPVIIGSSTTSRAVQYSGVPQCCAEV